MYSTLVVPIQLYITLTEEPINMCTHRSVFMGTNAHYTVHIQYMYPNVGCIISTPKVLKYTLEVCMPRYRQLYYLFFSHFKQLHIVHAHNACMQTDTGQCIV